MGEWIDPVAPLIVQLARDPLAVILVTGWPVLLETRASGIADLCADGGPGFALLLEHDGAEEPVRAAVVAAAKDVGREVVFGVPEVPSMVPIGRTEFVGAHAPPRLTALLVLDAEPAPALLAVLGDVLPIDVDPHELAANEHVRRRQIVDAANAAAAALQHGVTPVIYPTRGDAPLAEFAGGFGAIVAGIEKRSGFAVISASFAHTVLVDGFGARSATVRGRFAGQLHGWTLDARSRYPELPVLISGDREFEQAITVIREIGGF